MAYVYANIPICLYLNLNLSRGIIFYLSSFYSPIDFWKLNFVWIPLYLLGTFCSNYSTVISDSKKIDTRNI